MAFRETSVPADTDLLCEACGYILNGLEANPSGRCPECGEPLNVSLDPHARTVSPIEAAWTPRNFWKTTALVLFKKRRFFRETLTRVDSENVTRFGGLHRAMAGVLFGIAAATHLAYMAETRLWTDRWTAFGITMIVISGVVLTVLSALLLIGITQLSIAMTTAESRFWGMRLPRSVLVRAMNFHAANYLPVGIMAVVVTVGYRALTSVGILTPVAGVAYLVTLCAAVVVGAVWLFESFVIAMRRIRLANF